MIYAYILLIFLFSPLVVSEEAHVKRKERAAVILSRIAMFAIEDLASFGLGAVLDELTDNEDEYDVIISKLDQIIVSLTTMKAKMDQIEKLINELKSRQTIINALDVERKLRVLIENYQTLTNAIRAFDPNAGSAAQQREQLQKDIVEVTKALKAIPGLLTEFHLVITGESTVGAGRLSGLACEYVESCLEDIRTASIQEYDVPKAMGKTNVYEDSLMRLQVASFQLYNTTCAEFDLTCKENEKRLEKNLNEQNKRFQNCRPSLFQKLRSNGISTFQYIIHTSNQALYTTQRRSIVTDGTFDWDKIEAPQDAGLRCPFLNSSDELWAFQDGRASGRGGYYLKQKQGCYLSYDKNFIAYQKSFPTVWTFGDKIDRKEFLICLPTLSEQTVQFLVTADEASIDSDYTLKTASTSGKFLSIHIGKTSVHSNIDRRLVLVLFLDDKRTNSWKVLPEGSYDVKCDSSATIPEDSEDKTLLIIIGCCVAAAVLLIMIIVCCCCCPCCYCYHCRRGEV